MTSDLKYLSDEISNWHENDKHEEIINAISEISEEERGYELTCLLARAYNNTDDYEKALDLLLSVEEEGKYDLMWHFRIGYAYYYLDRLEKAEKAFERVLESDSGNEDALDFLDWIREEIKEYEEIKPEQEKRSLEDMIEWLSHENELGAPPSEIEAAGEFDLYGLHYYIYKYKTSSGDPWLLGVAGGYGRCDLDHCGHIFSEMEEYSPETAEEKAIALVEMLREAWMTEAEKELEMNDPNSEDELENTNKPGAFSGSVLLNSYHFDTVQIKAHLKNDWDIYLKEGYNGDPTVIDLLTDQIKTRLNNYQNNFSGEEHGLNPNVSDESILVFEVDGMTVAISFIGAPVPDGEAEYFAKTNYMWPDASDATKTHMAQIEVAVLYYDRAAVINAAKLYSKATACCLKLENAVGVYTSGTVFQPGFYIDVAELMKEDDLPILDWIYFGIYTSENKVSGYTYGLRNFGKEEIEIIRSAETPESVHDFLADISYYILKEDVDLKDGETIGFTEFQKVKIKKSKGIALDGYTFKIEY
jgi:Tfp pilus assembly protein PilF